MASLTSPREEVVTVRTYEILTYSELAPLLDALGAKSNRVETLRYSFDAPMAQPAVGLIVSFAIQAGHGLIGTTLLTELTKEGYRVVREQFLHLLNAIRDRDGASRGGRHYWERGQGAIEVGQLRFVVGSGITDAEFCRRMGRAKQVVENLPKFVTKQAPTAQRYTFWWNYETDSWQSGV